LRFAKLTRLFAFLTVTVLFAAAASAESWKNSLIGWNDPYYKVLNKNTHRGVALALGYFETKFIWFATHKSEAFRQAYTDFFNRAYPTGAPPLADKLGAPWMAASPNQEFFIALYSKDKKLEILGGDESLWDISLEVGSQVYKPILVENIETSPFEVRFFPYIERWYLTYRVVFPPDSSVDAGAQFKIVLNSVAGRNEIKFK